MTQLTGQTDGILPLEHEPAAHLAGRSLLADLSVMTKPRITVMVVITAYIGYAVGQRSGSAWDGSWALLLATLLGTALSCMGASVLNQFMERDIDALMHRTKDRPLPTGRIAGTTALLLGISLALTGVMLLALMVNGLVAGLSAFTIASYALIYTPLKRLTSVCTIVGAVPGALPPVMGFAASTGRLGVEAWVMFTILFLWQLPHFLAIAWLYKEDYARAGLPMLPVIDPDGRATSRQILLGCLALLPLGLLPTVVGMSGMIYFVGALAAGAMFLAFGVLMALSQTRRHARALFFASLVYLPLVFMLMLIDGV